MIYHPEARAHTDRAQVLQWLEPATVQLSSSRPALLLVLDSFGLLQVKLSNHGSGDGESHGEKEEQEVHSE